MIRQFAQRSRHSAFPINVPVKSKRTSISIRQSPVHWIHHNHTTKMPTTLTPPKTLNFITGNANKLSEVKAILADTPVELQSQSVDLEEVQGTIEEISTDKARRAANVVKGPVLVEDTCLSFNAMGELPGPYIKWFLKALKVEHLHKMLTGFDDKSAQAICTFAYCEGPGGQILVFQGRTEGKIVPSRGPTTFGWDSCFEYEGQTYAEMSKEAKNAISHRGKALEKLKHWLKTSEVPA